MFNRVFLGPSQLEGWAEELRAPQAEEGEAGFEAVDIGCCFRFGRPLFLLGTIIIYGSLALLLLLEHRAELTSSSGKVTTRDWNSMVDDIDLQLIHRLQENPRITYVALSRDVGVSEATVRRRVQRLFGDGIIRSMVIADLEALHLTVRAMAGIRTSPSDAILVAQQLCRFPNVTYVATTLGRFNVICFVAHDSLESLTTFLSVGLREVTGIHEIEVLMASDTLKNLPGWRVPVHEIDASETSKANSTPSIQLGGVPAK